MKETQQTEWKESLRDEFLKWICGFANAEGGVLHIDRNEQGVVVGVPNAQRLWATSLAAKIELRPLRASDDAVQLNAWYFLSALHSFNKVAFNLPHPPTTKAERLISFYDR